MLARLILVAANMALLLALGRVLTHPLETDPLASAAGFHLVRSTSAVEEPAAAPIANLERSHALARPLFAPERRPWQPAAPAVHPEPDPQPEPDYEDETEADLVVVGIGIARGRARALLMSGSGDPLGWVGEGDTVLDWTVAAISEEVVTVARAERQVSLNLHPDAPQP